MANAEHLAILRQGVDAWNAWREKERWVEPHLSDAHLSGANLSYANLYGANLIGADLGGAHLDRASLIDACLDGAHLTEAKLWETQRGGWSIKNVICRFAFWDRDGEELTKYEEGEFERIFAEKPCIILRYSGGISPIDLLALPLVVERLQAEYPGSALQIRSVQNDAGGASVTITVEDRENRTTEVFATELEALRRDLLTIQHRLHSEESLRLVIEAKYQAVMGDVLPLLLEKAVPKQEIKIGHLTGSTTIEGIAMSRDIYNIPGQAGAVGPGAHAEKNTFQQIQSGINLPKLAEELGRLRKAMKTSLPGYPSTTRRSALWPTQRRQPPKVTVRALCNISRAPVNGRSGSLRRSAWPLQSRP